MTILLGMGTGRSGTQSLSRLLNAQSGSVCFHELNPACMKWQETPQTVRSMIGEFEAVLHDVTRDVTLDFSRPAKDEGLDRLRHLPSVNTIGDVAFYYLPYVPMLAELDQDIKMLCIRRDRAEVIGSFMRAVRLPTRKPRGLRRIRRLFSSEARPRSHNHWQDHDGSHWVRNQKWDKLFPKFEADSLAGAIGQYWDFYQNQSEEYAARYPEKYRIFDIEYLNSEAGQSEILDYCQIDPPFILEEHRANSI